MPKIFKSEDFMPDYRGGFISKDMIKLVKKLSRAKDEAVLDKMEQTINYGVPAEIKINKKKLKKWVLMCSQLENIEHSNLIYLATKKKFADKNHEIEVYKKALELACKNTYGILTDFEAKQRMKMFIEQAEKELEEENK